MVQMKSYQQRISAELDEPVSPKLRAFAAHAAAGFGDTARVVMQCNPAPNGSIAGTLQIYVIVTDYDKTHDSGILKRANRLMPPIHIPLTLSNITADLAVISEEDLFRLSRANEQSAQIWADLANPVRMLWCVDEDARKLAARSVMAAPPTLLNAALAHVEREVDVIDLWQLGFDLAHSVEPGAERKSTRADPVAANPARYIDIGQAALCHTMIANEMRGELVHILEDPEQRIITELARWPLLRRRASWEVIGRQFLPSGA